MECLFVSFGGTEPLKPTQPGVQWPRRSPWSGEVRHEERQQLLLFQIPSLFYAPLSAASVLASVCTCVCVCRRGGFTAM